MKRTCRYCGRIHEYGERCPKKPTYDSGQHRDDSDASRIRHTNRWTKVSKSIRARDGYLCTMCLQKGVLKRDDLSVHHIIPINEDSERAFDGDNLITLCKRHHELADRGMIDRDVLFHIAHEMEENAF